MLSSTASDIEHRKETMCVIAKPKTNNDIVNYLRTILPEQAASCPCYVSFIERGISYPAD